MKKPFCLFALFAGLFAQAQDLTKLDTQLKTACPCTGVSIGSLTDKTTWRVDFLPGTTDAQKAAAQAVITAADPASIFLPPRVWTPYQFFQKFTDAEAAAVMASTDTTVKKFVMSMQLYQVVYPDDPACKAALDYIVSLGILTVDRETAILQ